MTFGIVTTVTIIAKTKEKLKPKEDDSWLAYRPIDYGMSKG